MFIRVIAVNKAVVTQKHLANMCLIQLRNTSSHEWQFLEENRSFKSLLRKHLSGGRWVASNKEAGGVQIF